MLRTLLRWPAALASVQPRPAGPAAAVSPDRSARLFVAGVWVAALALLLVFVARSVTRIPFHDEYHNVHLVVDPFGVPLRFYWAQHNEHRIPLPRVLFVAAVRLAGNDFRAPPFLNAALLAAASAVLVRAVARARGRYAYPDAFLPLAVMSIGQWENLSWGFQVQFVSSTVLALLMLALVIHPRFAASAGRVAAAGLVTLLVPLCGANGLALTPAFACLLLYVAARNLRSGDRSLRRPGVVALAGGLAGPVMLAAYLHGLQPVGHHTSATSWETVAVNAVNFLGIGFGDVARRLHEPGYPGFAALGLGMLALLAVTGGFVVAHVRHPEHRVAAVGVGCVIGAVLCLGLGLAYGRGAMGGLLGCNRYATLAMPLPVAVYVAWAVLPAPRPGRVVPVLLLLVALAGLWPNAVMAFGVAAAQKAKQSRVETEIRAGLPVTFVVDRHFDPADRDFIRKTFLALRDHGVKPFAGLVPDPPMGETPVPVRVVAVEGMDESGGFYRVRGERGGVVLALPQREYVYGLKLVYEAEQLPQQEFLSLASWEPGGTYPPRHGYGIISQLRPTHNGPAEVHVFVDRETDCLRIDLGNPGSAVRVHGLGVLTK